MSDGKDFPPRPTVPRQLLLMLAVAAAESREGPNKLQIGGVFPPSVPQLVRVRLESLCRDIVRTYAPPPAPPFSTPPAGSDSVTHTSRENEQAYRAHLEREHFKEALCTIMESDTIFGLAPREARGQLLELRELLRSLPTEGISR
jgi:hypothetical protein